MKQSKLNTLSETIHGLADDFEFASLEQYKEGNFDQLIRNWTGTWEEFKKLVKGERVLVVFCSITEIPPGHLPPVLTEINKNLKFISYDSCYFQSTKYKSL